MWGPAPVPKAPLLHRPASLRAPFCGRCSGSLQRCGVSMAASLLARRVAKWGREEEGKTSVGERAISLETYRMLEARGLEKR